MLFRMEKWNRFAKKIRFLIGILIVLLLAGCDSQTISEGTEAVLEEVETIPEEVETIPEEVETIPEESETVSEESETVLEESETVLEESETIPGESEIISEDSRMNVHILDVGQGLSVFVQCDDKNMIFDGGDRETSSYVVAYLKNMGVETLDYLICSHYDSDHISGLVGCLNVFQVKEVISPDYVHDSKTYQSFLTKVKEQDLMLMHPAVGKTFDFGTAKFVILAPETIDPEGSNENSVAIKLIHGENSIVITGDAEKNSEAAMCRSGLDLSCDILVAGHHGSATATTWDFLMATVPEYVVISCGTGNSYGHPHEETMEKLESMDVQLYRTDKQGWLSAVSDGCAWDWSQDPSDDYSWGDLMEKDEKTPVSNSAGVEEEMEEFSESEMNENDSGAGQLGNMDYVLNTNTGKFHYPNCKSVKDMKEKNKKLYTGSKEEVIGMGYEPCGNCRP